MTPITAHPATALRNTLGEGVLWDNREAEVVWVDIDHGIIYRGDLAPTGTVDITTAIQLEGMVGAVALAEDGGLLAATTRCLVAVSPEGHVSYGPDLLGQRQNARWNDGAIDPQGRFVVGSLPLNESIGLESLIRISATGETETLRTGITLSNGIGFSPDGSKIYHIDSIPGTLSSHSYGAGSFNVDEPWQLVTEDFDGTPDGLAVDSQGDLWVAEWGAGRVGKHSPEGSVLDLISVDAPQVTCPAFVGAALDVLAITTASKGLGDAGDGSGRLFIATHPGARGQVTPRWAGNTSNPAW